MEKNKFGISAFSYKRSNAFTPHKATPCYLNEFKKLLYALSALHPIDQFKCKVRDYVFLKTYYASVFCISLTFDSSRIVCFTFLHKIVTNSYRSNIHD